MKKNFDENEKDVLEIIGEFISKDFFEQVVIKLFGELELESMGNILVSLIEEGVIKETAEGYNSLIKFCPGEMSSFVDGAYKLELNNLLK